MFCEYTLPSVECAGGKGMPSGLIRAGLPVPAGFHITTEAYRCFVAANGIQPKILKALEGIDTGDSAAVESVSRSIGGFFAMGTIPKRNRDARPGIII